MVEAVAMVAARAFPNPPLLPGGALPWRKSLGEVAAVTAGMAEAVAAAAGERGPEEEGMLLP